MPLHAYKSLRAAGTSGAYLRGSVLKRLALALALILPVVWLLAALEVTKLDAAAERESRRDLENLTRAFAEEVNTTIRTVDMSLLQLRSHWQRNRDEFPVIVDELNRQLHDKVILQVSVVDKAGRLVYPGGRNIDFSDREHVRVHLDGHGDKLFVSRPVVGRISGVWVVQFTRPIYGADGKLDGVITASVPPAYFSRFYSNIDLGPGTSIGLVRADGSVIARATRAGGSNDTGKILRGAPYEPGHAPSGHFRRVGQLDGVDRYYAWRDLPGHGLMVTVGQAVQDANARYARQKLTVIWAGIAASVLLVLVGWVVSAAADNRRRALVALEAAEARWKFALNAAGEGVWDWDFATRQTTLSSRAQAILDLDDAVVPGTDEMLARLVHPEDLPRVRQAMQEHFERRTRDFAAEYRVMRRDGSSGWVLSRGMVAERTPDGRPLRMVGTFVSIDKRKSEEAQIRHQAHHDALTGLPNRLLFHDRLRQAIREAQRNGTKLAVLYFDLDKFKPVNDTYGHAAGDELLRQVARRVRASLRESDTLARVGGDEFVVLLPGCGGAPDAQKVGENILAQLNLPFEVDGQVLSISGSIGYAVYPDCGGGDEELLRCADQAMYHAKTHGRGRVSGEYAAAPPPAEDAQAGAAAVTSACN